MSRIKDMQELQARAQSHGEHLNSIGITMMAAIVGVLGAGGIFSATNAGNNINDGFLFLSGSILLLALLPHMLMLVARSNVVPNPLQIGHTASAYRSCLMSTMAWNRVRTWALASSWISLMFALIIVYSGLQDNLDGAQRSIGQFAGWMAVSWTLAVISYLVLVSVVVSFMRLLVNASGRKQERQLRSRSLLDLGGYQPQANTPVARLKKSLKLN